MLTRQGYKMKNQYRIAFALTLTSLLTALFSVAYAQPTVLKSASGINFMNGGIGREEVEEMRLVAKKFPLQILLSEGKTGTALTDVDLVITDNNKQTVFTLPKAGPMLYVDLPAGKYKVTGKYNEVKQSHVITLIAGEKSQRLILNWKSDEVEYQPEEVVPQ